MIQYFCIISGGLFIAIYLMSIWPAMFSNFTQITDVAKLMTVTVVFHYGLLFYSVWTVAYNFVPGGEYTREHTGWGLTFMALAIGLSNFTCEYFPLLEFKFLHFF